MRKSKNTAIHPLYLHLILLFAFLIPTILSSQIKPAAWRTGEYLPLIQGKKIAIVANQTSTIGTVHLVDSLQHLGIRIQRIFAPEHGFRGDAANGEKVHSGKDVKSGLPVVSLYGKEVKPKSQDLKDVDLVLFDIQDVGVRFYTFLSTMHYVMEACAENNVPLIILDRPNPNGHYIDGPILDTAFKSMVGMHPIPLVHGMTLGELALMINGEKWLRNQAQCTVTVIKCQNWNHNLEYRLPTPPSPNLPTFESIILYPTLGLLEGTVMSMGRGTDKPFECFGAPWLTSGRYTFTPKNIPGKAVNPPFVNEICHGYLVTDFARNYLLDFRHIYLEWFELLLSACPDKQTFFNPFFDKLAGTNQLRKQLLSGKKAAEIRASWQPALLEFSNRRKPYMLYSFDPANSISAE